VFFVNNNLIFEMQIHGLFIRPQLMHVLPITLDALGV